MARAEPRTKTPSEGGPRALLDRVLRTRTLILTGPFLAALFLGGGIATAVSGNDFMDTLRAEQEAGRLASDDPRIDQGLFLWIGADAGFALSVILGALSLYYFLYDPLPPSEGTVRESRDWAFAPMVDPQQGVAGMSFGGRF